MATQLTPEQEERIQAVVSTGAYHSVQEALDAAVAAVEVAATPGFEGTQQELEGLLLEGLRSGDPIPVDELFWKHLAAKTDGIAADLQASKSQP